MADFDLAAFTVGIVDCFVTLGLGLVEKGIVTREELAAAFAETARQGAAKAAENGMDALPRTMTAAALAAFFEMPVAGERPRLRVVDGGAND